MCARGLSSRGTSSFNRTSREIFIVQTGRCRALERTAQTGFIIAWMDSIWFSRDLAHMPIREILGGRRVAPNCQKEMRLAKPN